MDRLLGKETLLKRNNSKTFIAGKGINKSKGTGIKSATNKFENYKNIIINFLKFEQNYQILKKL